MASVTVTGAEQIEQDLARLPLELRGTATQAGLRAAGSLVVRRARQLVPQPGYPGDKPEFKPLRDTLATEVRGYTNAMVAVVGPKRPAGSHGHLVEESHAHYAHGQPTGIRTKATPFMGPASRETKLKQQAAVTAGIKKAVEKAIGKAI